MNEGGIINLIVIYSNVEGGGYASELGNISGDPEFRDGGDGLVPAGNDGKFGTIDDELRLSIEDSSPCIDTADGDFAPNGDIANRSRIDIANLGVDGGKPPDMGAYEASNKAIVVICFIDESKWEPVYLTRYYYDSDTYDSHLDQYYSFAESFSDYILRSSCRVPPHPSLPQTIESVLPQGYSAPEGISVEVCTRPPSLTELQNIFYAVKGDFDAEYVAISVDNSGSLKTEYMGSGYTSFIDWLENTLGYDSNHLIVRDSDEFIDQAWVLELIRAVEEFGLE